MTAIVKSAGYVVAGERTIEAIVRGLVVTAAAGLGGRVFPGMIPEGADLPAAAIWRADTSRDYSMDGQSAPTEARINVACYGARELEARSAAAAIVRALSGYRGEVNGVTIDAIFIFNESDDYDDRASTFQSLVQLTVKYRE